MKILVISNLYPSKSDPTFGTFVRNFVVQLEQSHDYEVVDKCLIKGRSSGLMVKICKYMVFYTQIITSLVFNRYDVVYVHLITHAALPLRFVNMFKKLPLIFNIHGEDLLTKTKLSAWFLELVTPLLIKSKMVVVPSKYFKAQVIEHIPSLNPNLIYMSASGGVDVSFFKESVARVEDSDIFNIGYVSRIDRGKGWDTLLDAIKILGKRGKKIKVKFAGTGAQVEMFKQSIEEHKLDNVDYLGAIPYDQLPCFYKTIDLFVFPTKLDESLGLVGLEAMACHIPIIAPNNAGPTDYVKDGLNGFIFEKADAQSLANQIERYMILSQNDKVKMQQEAYATALEYRSDSVAERLLYQIKKVIANG